MREGPHVLGDERGRVVRALPEPPLAMTGSLWALVRDRTRQAHAAVESVIGLPGTAGTREDYCGVLHGLLSAWAPLERAVAAAGRWHDVPLDPHLGEAAHLIADDLARLGAPAATSASPPAPAPEEPCLPRFGHALGARYVLLGSALGGRVLAPVIERQLRLAPGEATSFLRRQGVDPVAQWRLFRSATARFCALAVDDPADDATVVEDIVEDVVNGASTAFAWVGSAFTHAVRCAPPDRRALEARPC